MGRTALALALLFSLAPATAAAATHRAAPARGARSARPVARPAGPKTLAEAKAAMSALMRDRSRRRYHHQWEKAIAGLLRFARGRDAAAANLEAARARYALYRWSANEADRELAIELATRATRLGSKDAQALARAIRAEAGESEERPSPSRKRAATVAAVAPPRAPPKPGSKLAAPAPEPTSEEAEEDSAPDPALEAAVADLSPAATPSHRLGTSGGEGPAHVSEIRTWASDDYTRVAVYLSHWAGWQKLELPAAPDRPRRIALDLRPAVLDGAAVARPVGGDRVERVRAAQNDPETVRVVLELPGGDGVQMFALDDPPRLVLDVGSSRLRRESVASAVAPGPSGVASTSTATSTATATATSTATSTSTSTATATSTSTATPTATATPTDAETAAVVSSLTGPGSGDEPQEEATGPVRRIVIDAGHGGHDPGAIGPGRVREKDVTLGMARRLAKRLQEAGFEVVLTRKDDRYLALEERTGVANAAHGHLFISIHANANPKRKMTGVESYFLNTESDRYASRLAARENGLDLGDGDVDPQAKRILTDFGAKASAGASRKLAQMVQREVTSGVRARVGEVRDLGVKSALFYVLLGARMPAVLVETAFISNRDEERRLASTRYQEEVAAGIARAVATFARSGDRVAAAR